MSDYFVHESAYVDEGARVGAGTKIWHFCHVMPGAEIGERCSVFRPVVWDGCASAVSGYTWWTGRRAVPHVAAHTGKPVGGSVGLTSRPRSAKLKPFFDLEPLCLYLSWIFEHSSAQSGMT